MRFRTFMVLMSYLILAGCGKEHPDYAITLPNGYELVRGNPEQVMIVNSSGTVVVPGLIVKYGTVGDFVTGRAEVPPLSVEEVRKYFADVKPGYFLLDTRLGTVETGLSEKDWKSRIKSAGIEDTLHLTSPSSSSRTS